MKNGSAVSKIMPREPLLYLAAAFQALQFGLAGSVYFGAAGWVIGGLGGVVVNFSIAKTASRISDIARTRRPLAWAGFVGLMFLSPLAVAPAGFMQMSVITVLWIRIMAAIVWAVIPDAAILLTGAVSGKSLVRDEAHAPSAQTRTSKRSASKSVQGAADSAKSATHYPRRCAHCAADVPDSIALMKNPNAVGGHMKKNHPEKCRQKTVTFLVKEENVK